MANQIVPVPDLGGTEKVTDAEVLSVFVEVGDVIAQGDNIVELETDKSVQEIPSPYSGKVVSIVVKEGDKLGEGDALIEMAMESAAPNQPEPAKANEPKAAEQVPLTDIDTPILVPDLGGADSVEVIELCVAPGADVAEGDSLIVVETDKASMDLPATASGTLVRFSVKEGDKVAQGDEIGLVAVKSAVTNGDDSNSGSLPSLQDALQDAQTQVQSTAEHDVTVPDLGDVDNVDVIDILVAVGDEIAEGDSIVVVETDKASMDIPSPYAGKVTKLTVKDGDKVGQGDLLLTLLSSSNDTTSHSEEKQPSRSDSSAPSAPALPKRQRTSEQFHEEIQSAGSAVYAGPAVRKLAREMGVDLGKVKGSGPRSRISKDDVKAFVKRIMENSASSSPTSGAGIPAVPAIDFTKFGEVELLKMSKIKKVTAVNMSRNWLNVPHVTQFDDADITQLEAFRKEMKADAEKAGAKLTPVPFILKACAAALNAESIFNVSLHEDGEHLVQKKYIHIGMAVDTPRGLVVPVIRDVDKKGIYDIAKEVASLAVKARDGKLSANEMQGGCFTISSLGPIGGTGFTPIVNAPEVAILGISKASIKPIWNGTEFEPRQMLPLCLSYDHRAINGGDAGRFMTYLTAVLGDVRRLIL